MSDERRITIEALGAVQQKGAKPRDAVDRGAGDLQPRDRAFVVELVYGVLRHRDTLDWILKKFMKNPPKGRTMDNLRAALYQIKYLRVPDFAAVNEAVSLESRYKGLANAVLRNIIRELDGIERELRSMEALAADPATADKEFIRTAALLTSHPRWLIRRWTGRFGREGAYALARANNEIPPLTLRANLLRASRDEIIEKLADLGLESHPTRYSPAGVRLEGTVPFERLEPLSRLITVQDEAAQLVSLMLAPQPGNRVLDACAAPGGKSTHLAELMRGEGEVTAVEVDEIRIRRLRENVAAHGMDSVKVVHADIRQLEDEQGFDRVLVDAPCSSTGVIRRNPDVRYRHREADLAGFGEKQLELLRSGARLLKPEGELQYCTCSTEPEEGEDVVREFLRTSPDFLIIEEAPPMEDIVKDGILRTYPHMHGTDGFFAVKLGRKR